MRARYDGLDAVRFAVADVCNLDEYAEGTFELVVDKGTLDALTCGTESVAVVAKAQREIARVLRPGGVYLQISHSCRMDHMLLPAWDVQETRVL